MTACRVVIWNLWWRFGDWQQRFEAISAELASPDVVGLQEVWARGSVNAAGLLAKRNREQADDRVVGQPGDPQPQRGVRDHTDGGQHRPEEAAGQSGPRGDGREAPARLRQAPAQADSECGEGEQRQAPGHDPDDRDAIGQRRADRLRRAAEAGRLQHLHVLHAGQDGERDPGRPRSRGRHPSIAGHVPVAVRIV